MDLKYYIYASDSKVDMLFAQIPKELLSELAGELKVNLGVVSVSLKQDSPEETRYSKLAIVRQYIEKHAEVGTIDDPKDYFAATVIAKWGPLSGEGVSSEIVYFGGVTSHTVFGLGGSLSHVVGARSEGKTQLYSTAPYLLLALSQADPKVAEDVAKDVGLRRGPASQDFVMHAVRLATERLTGPEQRLEFLAKRLVEASSDDPRSAMRTTLLGSPIYVALAD